MNMEPVALLYWIRPSIIQKQTTLPHLSVLPGDHQGTIYIEKIN